MNELSFSFFLHFRLISLNYINYYVVDAYLKNISTKRLQKFLNQQIFQKDNY